MALNFTLMSPSTHPVTTMSSSGPRVMHLIGWSWALKKWTWTKRKKIVLNELALVSCVDKENVKILVISSLFSLDVLYNLLYDNFVYYCCCLRHRLILIYTSFVYLSLLSEVPYGDDSLLASSDQLIVTGSAGNSWGPTLVKGKPLNLEVFIRKRQIIISVPWPVRKKVQ